MQIRVKRLHKDAVIPSYAHIGDSGFDLVAVEDVIVTPGETVKVPTGLAFEIPAGYELQVRPRSGITTKTRLRVQLGTVDSGYRGEISVMVDNILPANTSTTIHYQTVDGKKIPTEKEWAYGGFYGNDEYERHKEVPYGTYIIRKGDRIAQAVIAPVIRAELVEAVELDETERGADGFGSSGV